ncbi:MAG: hypothetical protein P8166_06860 [Candidatus Thiodiazotropha sp.]
MTQAVEIYSDGACKGNPGPGGWGVLLRYGKHEKQLFGGESQTTNNRMELTAVIRGLEGLKRSSKVCVITDSQYVKNGRVKGHSGHPENELADQLANRGIEELVE